MNMVTLKAADGHTLDAYRVAPSTPPRGAIVVIQEIFGVNSHIRSVADGFAAEGWLAIAPAMFDRVERGIELGYTPADIERGRAIRAKVSNEAALRDMAAAVDAVKSVGKVAVIGYCWGGTLAWLAACKQPGLAAAVSYYGGGVGELLGLKPQCPVMAHFGDKDASIPVKVADDLKKAHPEVEVYVYSAGHGFNCDQRGSFDPQAAALARERTLKFFKAHV
ncbi:MAG TPA: dienelactone hydrolase family protein [Caldimonas sp.]|nr:dienelactone hydrolase family protein [Caldimonas sp.]